jgi:hypothetical protein
MGREERDYDAQEKCVMTTEQQSNSDTLLYVHTRGASIGQPVPRPLRGLVRLLGFIVSHDASCRCRVSPWSRHAWAGDFLKQFIGDMKKFMLTCEISVRYSSPLPQATAPLLIYADQLRPANGATDFSTCLLAHLALSLFPSASSMWMRLQVASTPPTIGERDGSPWSRIDPGPTRTRGT